MDFHEEEVVCDEGEFKSTTQTSTGLKSILRKVMTPQSNVEFSSTSTPLVIDSTSCVLPSNLRQRPLTVTTVTPKKAAVATISSHIAKINSPLNKLIKTDSNNNNVSKQCSGSVAPMCGGFVKNNMAFFNKNSTPANNTGVSVVKKVNKTATTAREALLRWCHNRTSEYSNVSVDNFSSSWSNGLAFCALIHHFMPDAFDYDILDAKNARFNFELAFKIAEDKAGIVPLLDVDDMIEMGNSPDWKCVFTYVHSIYQRFKEAA